MGIWSWASRQIQTATGESERREKVRKFKETFNRFKVTVSASIDVLNQVIARFNQQILQLNKVRSTIVKQNINSLEEFLTKFGKCKPCGDYVDEHEKLPAEFPAAETERLENYLQGIDESSDEIFYETFFLTPIGAKFCNRRKNLSMHEAINNLKLQIDATIQNLENRQHSTEQEIEICKLYLQNVQFISQFIREQILPELAVVEAFFQAEKIKNEILCGSENQEFHFSYDVRSIIDTDYAKHYLFVKNAFLFYVISCKIYDTAVLSNLLDHNTSDADIRQLEAEGRILHVQAGCVNRQVVVSRG